MACWESTKNEMTPPEMEEYIQLMERYLEIAESVANNRGLLLEGVTFDDRQKEFETNFELSFERQRCVFHDFCSRMNEKYNSRYFDCLAKLSKE